MQFSFNLEGSCPHCGKQLEEVGSVLVNGREACVSNYACLSEDGDTDLILTDYSPEVRCRYCNNELDYERSEES